MIEKRHYDIHRTLMIHVSFPLFLHSYTYRDTGDRSTPALYIPYIWITYTPNPNTDTLSSLIRQLLDVAPIRILGTIVDIKAEVRLIHL